MKTFTLVAITIALVFTTPARAKKLTRYECTSYSAARACEHGCRVVRNLSDGAPFEMDFLINERKNLVMARIYSGSAQPFNTHVLKNCSIFDADNWDCSEQIPRVKEGIITHLVESMTNGQYLSGVYHTPRAIQPGNLGFCAK